MIHACLKRTFLTARCNNVTPLSSIGVRARAHHKFLRHLRTFAENGMAVKIDALLSSLTLLSIVS